MSPMPGQQPAPTERLLIVDADKMMCELLQYRFETEGFTVDIVHTVDAALAMPLGGYHIILVDLMDNAKTGLRFTRTIRDTPETYSTPVVIISAKASEDDIVDGFDAGADDYISKPFSTRELIARVRSLLRRRRMTTARRISNVYRYKTLTVDIAAGTVTIDDAPVALTRTEYLILTLFMRHRNHFFDRAEIQHEAWEEDNVGERAVDTGISRLRRKLGAYGKQIVNRQGFGYGFIE